MSDLQKEGLTQAAEEALVADDATGKGLTNDMGPATLSGLKRLKDNAKFKKAWAKITQI